MFYAIMVVPTAYVSTIPVLYALGAGIGLTTAAPGGFMRGMMSATVPADQQVTTHAQYRFSHSGTWGMLR